MADQAAFWDKIAERYAARPVDHPDAYAATLDRARAHLDAEARVLEVGCGTGSTAIALAPSVAAYRATDISVRMVEIARAKPEAQALGHLTFAVEPAGAPDGPFDAILAFNLIHLLPDPAAGLRRMAAQLRPGGRLISKTPCLGDLSLFLRVAVPAMQWMGKAPAVKFLTARGLDRAAQAAGFDIVETDVLPKAFAQRLLIARRP